MTEVEWLQSVRPQRMCDFLKSGYSGMSFRRGRYPGWNERRQRLFSRACALAAEVGFQDTFDTPDKPLWGAGIAAERSITTTLAYADTDTMQAACAAYLRDIIGNPFRPCEVRALGGLLAKDWLLWNDGTVQRLAQQMYAQNDFSLEAYCVLHDALQEAGCDEEEVLRHVVGEERCRDYQPVGAWKNSAKRGPLNLWPECIGGECGGTGWVKTAAPHVKGCWVVDLLIGKE